MYLKNETLCLWLDDGDICHQSSKWLGPKALKVSPLFIFLTKLYLFYMTFYNTPAEIQFSSSNNLSIPISSMVSAIQDILRCFSKYKRSKLLLTGDEITRIPLDLQAWTYGAWISCLQTMIKAIPKKYHKNSWIAQDSRVSPSQAA